MIPICLISKFMGKKLIYIESLRKLLPLPKPENCSTSLRISFMFSGSQC